MISTGTVYQHPPECSAPHWQASKPAHARAPAHAHTACTLRLVIQIDNTQVSLDLYFGPGVFFVARQPVTVWFFFNVRKPIFHASVKVDLRLWYKYIAVTMSRVGTSIWRYGRRLYVVRLGDSWLINQLQLFVFLIVHICNQSIPLWTHLDIIIFGTRLDDQNRCSSIVQKEPTVFFTNGHSKISKINDWFV